MTMHDKRLNFIRQINGRLVVHLSIIVQYMYPRQVYPFFEKFPRCLLFLVIVIPFPELLTFLLYRNAFFFMHLSMCGSSMLKLNIFFFFFFFLLVLGENAFSVC